MSASVRLAITPGEPAGIGPELCAQLHNSADVSLTLIADESLIRARAEKIGVTLDSNIHFHHVPLATKSQAGQLLPDNADYVLQCLRIATQGCLDGDFDALVTGPVHKGIINDAGIPFTGHTEYLAALTDTPLPVMMLAVPGLRVALATTHLPLQQVPSAITQDSLESVIRILQHDLQHRFAIPSPRILVCGLNPHAGENGHLGTEEIDTIIPVLQRLRDQGMQLIGPLSADTLFTDSNLAVADAVLAMYHDQGLPVLKHMGFGEAVNITLGLPVIRTSVDHGTALELAGTGKASPRSLQAAIDQAVALCQRSDAA